MMDTIPRLSIRTNGNGIQVDKYIKVSVVDVIPHNGRECNNRVIKEFLESFGDLIELGVFAEAVKRDDYALSLAGV